MVGEAHEPTHPHASRNVTLEKCADVEHDVVVRRRVAGPEPSPRAYRRRPKHVKTKPEIEPED